MMLEIQSSKELAQVADDHGIITVSHVRGDNGVAHLEWISLEQGQESVAISIDSLPALISALQAQQDYFGSRVIEQTPPPVNEQLSFDI